MNEYLEMDGSLILNIALYNRAASITDSCYAEICGGFIAGVYQWADHNIYFIDEVSNHKYTGFIVNFNNGVTRKYYIENWVMESKPKDFKHARNLFNKFLKEAPQNH